MKNIIRNCALALAALGGVALLAAPVSAEPMSGLDTGPAHHRHYAHTHRGARGFAAYGFDRPRIFAVTPRGVYYRYSPGLGFQGPGFGIGFSTY